MVSYYNSLSYSQRHSANLPYPPTQHWFPSNYHPPSNHQFLNDVDSTHHQHMYYNPHMLHQAGADWHSAATAHDHYSTTGQTQLIQQHQHQQQHDSTTTTTVNQLNDSGSAGENLTEGLPSPPITVSGSEISSPGAPNASSSPNGIGLNGGNIHNRPAPAKSPYYDWMKKPSYPTQPTPGSIEICSAPSLQDFTAMEPSGKTRTKDKYRVVYTDYQRLELEKEYHTSKYITIRRKTELAQALQLSERQVKIWFQNRRAKERKQNKKRDDPLTGVQVNHHHHHHHSNNDLANLIDTKPKIENGLHLQHHHPLHQMSSMAMGMSPMSLHHSVLHHGHHLGVPPHPPPPPPPPSSSSSSTASSTASQLHHHHHHHLHQSHQQVTAVAATVGALTM